MSNIKMTVVNSTTGLNDTEYSLSDNKGMLKYDKAALDECCDIINSHDTLTAKVAELEKRGSDMANFINSTCETLKGRSMVFEWDKALEDKS